MNVNEACHAIALEVAKAFVSSNMSECINDSSIEVLSKDMTQKYIDAYKAAENVFHEPQNISKAKAL